MILQLIKEAPNSQSQIFVLMFLVWFYIHFQVHQCKITHI